VSFESLLLVAFLLVIPLLERLVRGMRTRSRPHPADLAPVPAPSRLPLPRPAVPERAPDAFGASDPTERTANIAPSTPTSLPPLPERHPAAKRFTSRERARASRGSQELPVTPVFGRPAPHTRRRGTSLRGISAELRRSIVLMSILGPCKALDHDGGHGSRPTSQRSGRVFPRLQ
jgi:hypothetical protein